MEDFIQKVSSLMTDDNIDIRKVVEELQTVFLERNELEKEVLKLKKGIAKTEEMHGQEVHSLRARILNLEHMEPEYQEEISGLQRELTEKVASLEVSYEARIQQYKDEVKEQQLTIEQHQQQHAVMEERMFELEQKVASAPANLTATGNDTSLLAAADEYHAMREQIITLKDEQAELTSRHNELQTWYERSTQNLGRQLADKTSELDSARSELTTCYRTLERERDILAECQVEIESLKMDRNRPDQKGNSLFAELEDRRVKAEQRLVTVSQQYEEARRSLEHERMLRHRLKVQMTSLLQTNNSRYTDDHMERLNCLITQLKSDKQNLMDKLQASERAQKQHLKKFTEVQTQDDVSDRDKAVSSFLEAMLKYKESEVDKLKAEVQEKSMTVLSRTDRAHEYHRKLVECEGQISQLKNTIARKDLEIEELKAAPIVNDNRKKSTDNSGIQYQVENLSGFTDDPAQVPAGGVAICPNLNTSYDDRGNPPISHATESAASFEERSPLHNLDLNSSKTARRKPKHVNIADSCTVIEYGEEGGEGRGSTEAVRDRVYSASCETEDRGTATRKPKARTRHEVIKATGSRVQSGDCKQQ